VPTPQNPQDRNGPGARESPIRFLEPAAAGFFLSVRIVVTHRAYVSGPRIETARKKRGAETPRFFLAGYRLAPQRFVQTR
jgi:hypothetical protein